jgi:hypothetical protein
MMVKLRDTGIRLRGAAVTGSYGSQELDWTSPDQLSLACEFQPQTGTEDVTQQQRTETTWQVFLEAGADITAQDRWRFDGVDYEVVAEPERWRFHGREHHVEVEVRLVVGG